MQTIQDEFKRISRNPVLLSDKLAADLLRVFDEEYASFHIYCISSCFEHIPVYRYSVCIYVDKADFKDGMGAVQFIAPVIFGILFCSVCA